MRIKMKKLRVDARLPEYKSEHATGADVFACLDTDVEIQDGQTVLVPTGLAMEIPPGYEAQIRPRSGMALKGVTVPNSPGTIDADYRGEVKIILHYRGETPFVIRSGDRIAQMIIAPVSRAEFETVEELSETDRGEGGFGSTGHNG